jgi:hypothetical protein
VWFFGFDWVHNCGLIELLLALINAFSTHLTLSRQRTLSVSAERPIRQKYSQYPGSNRCNFVHAQVVITDSAGRRVPGARVSGRWFRRGRAVENGSGSTAAGGAGIGSVILRTTATWASFDQSLRLCVTAVTKGSYTYEPRANRVTCVDVKPRQRAFDIKSGV